MALQQQVVSSDLSNGFVCYQLADDDDNDGPRHSVINFKNNGSYNTSFSSESLLSFEKNDHDEPDAPVLHKSHEMMTITNSYLLKTNNEDNICLSGDLNSFQQTSEGSQGSANYGWLYSDSTTLVTADSFPESDTQVEAAAAYQKRPNTGESTQPLKKQCTSAGTGSTVKKPRAKSSSPSKDPQSIAAKNRRERISERLKILQELVPNGCKVDLVTMLEKAYSYVKFLQLQVKVLATDEFWPVQGGKAPDISQVKEAIDAILSSSQRERERSSSSKL